MVQAVADYGAIPILMAPPPVPSDAGATAKLQSFADPFANCFDESDILT